MRFPRMWREMFRRNASRVAVLALAAVPVAGCSTLDGLVDPTVAAAALPDSPAAQPDGTPDWVEPAPDALPNADWVAAFGDAQLTALVEQAMLANPGLARSEALFDAALARRRISRADLYPTLGASSSARRSEGGTGFFAGSSTYDIGLNASWEVDLFGRVADGVSAATASAEASAADLAGLRASIAGQVSNLWIDAIEAQRLVALSEREIAAQNRVLRLTERRFAAGVVGGSDVRLARSALASAEALAVLRRQNAKTVVRQLETLIASYPAADLAVPETLPRLSPLEGAGGPSWVLRRRPDILAAERRIVEAGFNVDVARKALFPSLSLSAGVADQFATPDNLPGGIENIFDLSSLAYNYAAQLTAPIFQGGRIRANIDASEAQLRSQLATYADAVLTAYREVENALDAEGLLAEREAALRIALEEARGAEERLERRYIEGLATILQLLDAQTRSLNAEGQLIGAQAERLNNRVRLHVALGGGRWGDVIALPAPQPALTLPLIGDVAAPDFKAGEADNG